MKVVLLVALNRAYP